MNFLRKFSNSFVENFYKAVSSLIVCHRRHTLDPELVVESLKGLADELRPIIMDNPSWYAKEVDHVIFNKLDHVICLYLSQGNSFSPFGEIIDYG